MNSEKKKKITRYMSGYVYYKNVTCRLSDLDLTIINNYCSEWNISRSMFLAAAAVYCAQNKIDCDTLLDQTISNIDYEMMKAEEKEYCDEEEFDNEYEFGQDLPEM